MPKKAVKKSLADKVNVAMKKQAKPTKPAWNIEDGITQSILSRYVVCKERFRVQFIEGLRESDRFEKRIEYGNLFHLAEENFLAGQDWRAAVRDYSRDLCIKYPTQQEEISKWYQVCLLQYPIYEEYWRKHPDVKNRTTLDPEFEFDVTYDLPSGRVVKLRGKIDGLHLIGPTKTAPVYVQENKIKGELNEVEIARQLRFDLQTMIYCIVVANNYLDGRKLGGIWFNTILRPLSGGKGTIRPHKATKNKPAETLDEYYNRLAGIIAEEPDYYFKRWKVELTKSDLDKFATQFLNPCLENLLDDYEWWEYCLTSNSTETVYYGDIRAAKFPKHVSRHYRLPYGIYNPIAEGRVTDVDEYLDNGSTVGLKRTKSFYPELAETA